MRYKQREVEEFRRLWQEFAFGSEMELTRKEHRVKWQLRDTVGIDMLLEALCNISQTPCYCFLLGDSLVCPPCAGQNAIRDYQEFAGQANKEQSDE